MAEVVEIQKLKLAELKQECAERGLDAKGNKADLIARLQAYLEEHDEEVNEEEVLGDFAEESFCKDEASPPKPVKKAAAPETEAPEKKVVKISVPDSVGALQKRAERFNIPPSAETKKAARAARFGVPVTASAPSQGTGAASISAKTPVSVEVLKKRAERFGMNVSSISKKVEEDEKLKKRKERFGILTSAAGAAVGEDAEAKKRKRAERFGNV
ncbi:hypothetical protein ACEWY4_013627 [Coilia grayii]|uniref:SAP domain-containing protein n=1 Tax=Coilia grayii TaxID=363190 RepID=A0ABD1JWY9_9TELE